MHIFDGDVERVYSLKSRAAGHAMIPMDVYAGVSAEKRTCIIMVVLMIMCTGKNLSWERQAVVLLQVMQIMLNLPRL